MSGSHRRVVFRPEALAQLDDLYDFVAVAGSPSVAADLIEAIMEFCAALEPFPLRGVARDESVPGCAPSGFAAEPWWPSWSTTTLSS